MTRLRMVPGVLLLTFAAAACDTGLLDLQPRDEISEDVAIVDAETADAALNGVYSTLQSGGAYGDALLAWVDLLTDDVEHTGTFGTYGTADLLNVTADNGSVEDIWEDAYDGINRANVVIEKVTALDIDQEDADRIIGEALAVRALHYFDLVRTFGGVPLVLEPPASLDEASQVTRASAAEVYAAIETDLANAATRLAAAGVDNSTRIRMTPGFIDALLAQVHLYQEDWQAAEDAAMRVVDSGDYELVADYGDLFEADGAPTSEDIFRVLFTSTDANVFGYYYTFEGRFETGATQDIYDAYDQANDERFAVSFDEVRADGIEVVKMETTVGTEDIHVIRYGELLLMLAEAHAMQGELGPAVTYLEMVRDRAGLAPYPPAAVDTQAEVIDAIQAERRLELAFEGERWYDLVRWGRADELTGFDSHEGLLPIPVSELDVAENLVQNPGYEQ